MDHVTRSIYVETHDFVAALEAPALQLGRCTKTRAMEQIIRTAKNDIYPLPTFSGCLLSSLYMRTGGPGGGGASLTKIKGSKERTPRDFCNP
jgi:hypothetical protein